jgi:hypothetical protein
MIAGETTEEVEREAGGAGFHGRLRLALRARGADCAGGRGFCQIITRLGGCRGRRQIRLFPDIPAGRALEGVDLVRQARELQPARMWGQALRAGRGEWKVLEQRALALHLDRLLSWKQVRNAALRRSNVVSFGKWILPPGCRNLPACQPNPPQSASSGEVAPARGY